MTVAHIFPPVVLLTLRLARRSMSQDSVSTVEYGIKLWQSFPMMKKEEVKPYVKLNDDKPNIFL